VDEIEVPFVHERGRYLESLLQQIEDGVDLRAALVVR